MRKRISVLLVTMTLLAALCGCTDGTNVPSETTSTGSAQGSTTQEATTTGNDVSNAPTYGGTVVVGIQQDIDSLDPHKATAAGTKEILFNIFEGLVKTDENGDLFGAVASDYSLSEDGLVYTFTLRDGIKFHNGNEVTVEDVKYSLERVAGLLEGGEVLISTMSAITAVDIVDEKTVQVTVGSVNPELIYSFTAAIIPAGSGEDSNADPIGTGPFKYVSYTPQESIIVEKNADYWMDGVPYLDEVDFKIVADGDAALLELQGGTIQVYPYLTDSQAAALKGQMQVLVGASATVQALFINNEVEPLNNELVRQAICYAVNRDEINDFVAGGDATVISCAMLPTLASFYVDLNDVYGTTGNAEKAKELLTQAGYPDGFDLTITVPSNYEYHVQTTEVLAEQLKAAGINVTIDQVEWNTWLSEVYTDRKYETTVCAITGDMTPGYLLSRFVSDSKKNFINFNSKEYDEAYANVLASTTLEDRAVYYKQMQEILVKEAGTAFTQVGALKIAVDNKLQGYKFYPVYVQDMSCVYYAK